MLLNVHQNFKTIGGEVLKQNSPIGNNTFQQTELTLGDVMMSSLERPDNATTEEDRKYRFLLSVRIMEAMNKKDPLALTDDEVVMIKQLINATYNTPLVAGQACLMIDNAPLLTAQAQQEVAV